MDAPKRHKRAEVGATIGGYELARRIGRGGMAEVWVARRVMKGHSAKFVALKLIADHFVGDERYDRMFKVEAELSAILNHANIVQVFDEGEEDGRSFLVMEWVDGINLLKLGAVLSLVDEEQRRFRISAYIIGQLLHALSYAHSITTHDGSPLGIVHRDVSPQNVLVSNHGEVKLTDFGVAHHVLEESSGLHVKGKVRYMAPEQLAGNTRSPTVDLFAVGALLHELLDGKKFRGELEDGQVLYTNVLAGKIPPLSRPIPPELDALRLGLLEGDARRRIQSAEHALATLERYPDYGDARRDLTQLCSSLTGIVRPRAGPGDSAQHPRQGHQAKPSSGRPLARPRVNVPPHPGAPGAAPPSPRSVSVGLTGSTTAVKGPSQGPTTAPVPSGQAAGGPGHAPLQPAVALASAPGSAAPAHGAALGHGVLALHPVGAVPAARGAARVAGLAAQAPESTARAAGFEAQAPGLAPPVAGFTSQAPRLIEQAHRAPMRDPNLATQRALPGVVPGAHGMNPNRETGRGPGATAEHGTETRPDHTPPPPVISGETQIIRDIHALLAPVPPSTPGALPASNGTLDGAQVSYPPGHAMVPTPHYEAHSPADSNVIFEASDPTGSEHSPVTSVNTEWKEVSETSRDVYRPVEQTNTTSIVVPRTSMVAVFLVGLVLAALGSGAVTWLMLSSDAEGVAASGFDPSQGEEPAKTPATLIEAQQGGGSALWAERRPGPAKGGDDGTDHAAPAKGPPSTAPSARGGAKVSAAAPKAKHAASRQPSKTQSSRSRPARPKAKVMVRIRVAKGLSGAQIKIGGRQFKVPKGIGVELTTGRKSVKWRLRDGTPWKSSGSIVLKKGQEWMIKVHKSELEIEQL